MRNLSIQSETTWVMVLSFVAAYSLSLFNLASEILKFNLLFLLMEVHWVAIHDIIISC